MIAGRQRIPRDGVGAAWAEYYSIRTFKSYNSGDESVLWLLV